MSYKVEGKNTAKFELMLTLKNKTNSYNVVSFIEILMRCSECIDVGKLIIACNA